MSFPFQELQLKRRGKILDEEDRNNGVVLNTLQMNENVSGIYK